MHSVVSREGAQERHGQTGHSHQGSSKAGLAVGEVENRIAISPTPSNPSTSLGNQADRALACLGVWLRDGGYRFTAVTPSTHAVVNGRGESCIARSLEDIFGWSRPFPHTLLPQHAVELLEQGEALFHDGRLLRSKVRFSTLEEMLFMHSAFPTNDRDTVFFGPDTYRFARFIDQALGRILFQDGPATVFDMGCGTGAGGMFAKTRLPAGCELVLADINARALHYAWVNAKLSGITTVTFRQGDLFQATPGTAALIIANPPYLVDDEARVYRNGGGALGSGLSLRIVREGLPKLQPGGSMVLYTGAPIVAGVDALREELIREAGAAHCAFSYEELDPDVFGEELHRSPYTGVDRIAAVGAVIRKSNQT
jgi:SAM-dependent methyltransferase